MKDHNQSPFSKASANQEMNKEDKSRISGFSTYIQTGKSPAKKKFLPVKILIIVFFFLFVIGGFIGYWEFTDKFVTVHKANLYRSAEIQSDKLIKLSLKHGIRTVVDLRVEEDKAQIESNVLSTIGVRHVHLPSGQIPTQEAVVAFIKIMDDPKNRPVLIHCIHGIGRTGIFSAIYRIEYQKWSSTRALLEAMMLAGFGSFRPNSDKAKFITSYKPRD